MLNLGAAGIETETPASIAGRVFAISNLLVLKPSCQTLLL